jgi:4a-hydroxytetrahydrobiopterin dehydratase
MREPLTDDQIAAGLTPLKAWSRTGDSLRATYSLKREQVLPFYIAVSAAEDELDHHAEVRIVYGTVAFALTTHSAGNTVTGLDLTLAARIAALAEGFGG